eukprot:TRINITY_DN27477_c0_g1_i1.p1 TRINITY_DN27477_c0_g1~~TRINITY_DN27477_c0_g1_i1.p1  ORF type:complete len:266 (+),score=47.69 TRINITY_DN27477_c0_g1_i1:66-800(+)
MGCGVARLLLLFINVLLSVTCYRRRDMNVQSRLSESVDKLTRDLSSSASGGDASESDVQSVLKSVVAPLTADTSPMALDKASASDVSIDATAKVAAAESPLGKDATPVAMQELSASAASTAKIASAARMESQPKLPAAEVPLAGKATPLAMQELSASTATSAESESPAEVEVTAPVPPPAEQHALVHDREEEAFIRSHPPLNLMENSQYAKLKATRTSTSISKYVVYGIILFLICSCCGCCCFL